MGSHFTKMRSHFTIVGSHFTKMRSHFTIVGSHFTKCFHSEICERNEISENYQISENFQISENPENLFLSIFRVFRVFRCFRNLIWRCSFGVVFLAKLHQANPLTISVLNWFGVVSGKKAEKCRMRGRACAREKYH